jgi:hypothetical protein
MISKITKTEKIIFISIFAFFISIFSTWKILQLNEGYGDSAFVIQLSNNIAQSARPVTQLMASIDVVLNKIVVAPAEKLCEMPLKIPEKSNKFNYFRKWHTYAILFVIAPLNLLFSSQILLPILTVISFFFLLGMVYWISRKKNIPVYASLLITLFIAIHPAWSIAIKGQIYIDRFFIGLAFLFIYLLNEYNSKTKLLYIVGFLITSITDRTGLLLGCIVFAHEFFSYLTTKQLNKKNLWLGFIYTFISFYLMKFYVQHPHYSSFASGFTLDGLKANLAYPNFLSNMIYFIVLNIGIYGLIGVFSIRYFLISLMLMIPNIFGNIGGAEKTGFFAHYHSFYLPVLAWAVMDGFSNIYNYQFKIESLSSRIRPALCILTLFLTILVSGSMGTPKQMFTFTKADFLEEGLIAGFTDLNLFVNGYKKDFHKVFSDLNNTLPPNSTIATVETMMPHFINTHQVFFYPVGIADVQNILIPYTEDSQGNITYSGSPSYLGPAEELKINACLKKKMEGFGFDVNHPTKLNGYALIKRQI